MAQHQVKCITKVDDSNPAHERIVGIGGTDGVTGGQFWSSEEEAIAGIKNGTLSFFVNVNNRPVAVIVATHERREYLKTQADGYAPNNLLSLPRCP